MCYTLHHIVDFEEREKERERERERIVVSNVIYLINFLIRL